MGLWNFRDLLVDRNRRLPSSARQNRTDCVAARSRSLSLAPGYKGYPTPARAITAFVASGTASFPLPKTGWTTVDHRMYASGTAHLELWHIPEAGYAVTAASNC